MEHGNEVESTDNDTKCTTTTTNGRTTRSSSIESDTTATTTTWYDAIGGGFDSVNNHNHIHENGAATSSMQQQPQYHNNNNNHEDHCSTSGCETTTETAGWWKKYQLWLVQHQTQLWMMDEIISRLLFWTPPSVSSRWREVMFGLLDLQRLFLQVATTTSTTTNDDNDQSFGTSVAVVSNKTQIPYAIRLGLTILQSILPMALELVRCNNNNDDNNNDNEKTRRRQGLVRQYIERIRFVLRLSLLVQYWYEIQKDNEKYQLQRQQSRQTATRRLSKQCDNDNSDSNTSASPISHNHEPLVTTVLPGLLLHGGMYHVPRGIPIDYERSRMERVQYVGKRTGRRIVVSAVPLPQASPPTTAMISPTMAKLRIVLGELLYICRPLVQAETNVRWISTKSLSSTSSSKNPQRLQSWLTCLAMDVVSLLLLHNKHNCQRGNDYANRRYNTRSNGGSSWTNSTNPVTNEEWNRRRMRLLLYLLRSPIWDRYTEPSVQRIGTTLAKTVPLVGSFLENYIWDYLLYWQQYRSEEG